MIRTPALALILAATTACSLTEPVDQRVLPGMRATLDDGRAWEGKGLQGSIGERGHLLLTASDSSGGSMSITIYYPHSLGFYQSSLYDNELEVTYTVGNQTWEANRAIGASTVRLDAVAADSVVGSFRLELAPVTDGVTTNKNFWNGTFSVHY